MNEESIYWKSEVGEFFYLPRGRRPPYWYWYGIILQMCILSTHFVLIVGFCVSLAFCSGAGEKRFVLSVMMS